MMTRKYPGWGQKLMCYRSTDRREYLKISFYQTLMGKFVQETSATFQQAWHLIEKRITKARLLYDYTRTYACVGVHVCVYVNRCEIDR